MRAKDRARAFDRKLTRYNWPDNLTLIAAYQSAGRLNRMPARLSDKAVIQPFAVYEETDQYERLAFIARRTYEGRRCIVTPNAFVYEWYPSKPPRPIPEGMILNAETVRRAFDLIHDLSAWLKKLDPAFLSALERNAPRKLRKVRAVS